MAKLEKGSKEWWEDYLTHGHRLEGFARVLFPILPANPRCKICKAPFRGFGKLLAPFGWSPSRKNPAMCGFCSNRLPAGGAEVPVAVLVADVCGYTTMSETMPAPEVASLMNAFFTKSSDILMKHDALIDKYMGDAVQALFLPGIAGVGFAKSAVDAAEEIAREFKDGPIKLRIAVHHGVAFVGNVGSLNMVDLTVMGDVVNTCHRLQGAVNPNEIVLSQTTWEAAGSDSAFQPFTATLKGKSEPVEARRRAY